LPDTTFAEAGVAQMAIPGATETIFLSIAVDPSNRIVAAGYYFFDLSPQWSPTRMLMARYLENGSLDTSFGTLGTLRQDWLDSHFLDVAIQPNGRILATAFAYPTGDRIWRFRADGSLDTDFGLGGVATYNPPVPPDGGIVLVRKPDGTNAFVVANYTTVTNRNKTTHLWALWRYFY
jgi:uncharacterized delta-60 repeat protein